MTFDLEKESLKASGIKNLLRVSEYLGKLNHIYNEFQKKLSTESKSQYDKAKVLFDWLWQKKGSRYKMHGNYRLNDVLNAQLSEDESRVGNCLGLTLLYNCLLKKMSINARALYLEYAFDIGPHVLTIIQTEKSTIDVENILKDGFDYKGHLNDPSRKIWNDKELVADIYQSRGNELFEQKKYRLALSNYNKAINHNPQYENAIINRTILLDIMETE